MSTVIVNPVCQKVTVLSREAGAIVQSPQAPLVSVIQIGLQGVPGTGGGAGGLAPSSVTSSTNAAVGFLYYVDALSIVSIQLPATAANGDRWGFINSGSAPVRITQGAGQQIVAGDLSTTVGVTGRLTSSVQGDWVEFYFYQSRWIAEIKSGYLEVV